MERSGLISDDLAAALALGVIGWGGWMLLKGARRTPSRAKRKRMSKQRAKPQAPPWSKTFDGKGYSQVALLADKKAAAARAAGLRKGGQNARVVRGRIKGTKSTVYVVYAR